MDWILEGRCWVDGQLTECCLGIDEETGTIESVRKVLTGAPVRRFPGSIVLPSAVDLHVHFRDPGFTQKEDFATGTRAALLGGVGTIFDMPNTKPVVDTPRVLEEKLETVRAKALVDYGLWGTISSRTEDPQAFAAAADGIKLYLAPTTGVEPSADDASIERAVAATRRAGRLLAVHAEDPIAPDPATLQQHDAARTVERERLTVERVAAHVTARDAVHICHASAEPVLSAALEAGLSVGLTPHHLMLHMERRWAMSGKVNPPLRDAATQAALWQRFVRGDPAIVETDHAPHRWEEKDAPFNETPAGLPGVQTAFGLLLRKAKAGQVPLEQVIAACCDRPARRIGIPKGRLAPGMAADFVVVDVAKPRRLARDWLASKAGWSPYEGQEILAPTHHVLGGVFAVEDGNADRKAGAGRRIRPARPGPAPQAGAAPR